MINSILVIFVFVLFFQLNKCIIISNNDYILLKYKEKKSFTLTGKEDTIFFLEMNLDEIDSSTYAYFEITLNEPTSVTFYYSFQETESKNFIVCEKYITINNNNEHGINYKIEKISEKGKRLYLKIVAQNFKEGQTLSIESLESENSVVFLLEMTLAGCLLLSVILCLVFFLYFTRFKRDKNLTETGPDIIVQKVYPKDYEG